MIRSALALCIWLAVTVPANAATSATAATSAKAVATVQTVSGQLTVQRKGVTARVPLEKAGSVYAGDEATTGSKSYATFLVYDGSEWRLNENSSTFINPPTRDAKGHQSLFRSVYGEVMAKLRPGKSIQTPGGIIGVRGTVLHLRVEADGLTTVTVLEGEVDFYNEQGGVIIDRKSTRLNSSHIQKSRMPSSA